MKKILLVAMAVAMMSIVSNAQTQKGWYLIGGHITDIGVGFQKNNTTFNLGITPRAAWFVQDNLAIGGQVALDYRTQKGSNTFKYNIGPIVRYYFPGEGVTDVKHTRFFLDGNVGIAGATSKSNGVKGVSTNGLGIGAGPGLAYFINENVALEAMAKYNLTVGFGNSTTENALSIGVGFQIHLPTSKIKEIRNRMN